MCLVCRWLWNSCDNAVRHTCTGQPPAEFTIQLTWVSPKSSSDEIQGSLHGVDLVRNTGLTLHSCPQFPGFAAEVALANVSLLSR